MQFFPPLFTSSGKAHFTCSQSFKIGVTEQKNKWESSVFSLLMVESQHFWGEPRLTFLCQQRVPGCFWHFTAVLACHVFLFIFCLRVLLE